MSEETKTPAVELVMDRDTLVTHRNNFQKSLLGNLLDLRHHENIKKNDPEFKRMVSKERGVVGIDELIEDYKHGLESAISYVEIIDALLQMDADGKLSDAWSEKKEEEVETEQVVTTEDTSKEETEETEEVQGEAVETTPEA